MKIRLFVYDKPEWQNDAKLITSIDYCNVESWQVLELPYNADEIEEIESETSEDGIDVMHEYLVLYFKDGKTYVFRYSNVVLEDFEDNIEYKLHVKNQMYDNYETFTDAKIEADEIIKTMTEYGTYADGAVTILRCNKKYNKGEELWIVNQHDLLLTML